MSKRCPMCKGKGFLMANPTQENLYKQAHNLRKSGYSFREIAKVMGFNNASSAKHYYEQWQRIKPRKFWRWAPFVSLTLSERLTERSDRKLAPKAHKGTADGGDK